MLTVEWKHDAIWDLIEIVDYIAQENQAAADNIKEQIHEAAERIAASPYACRAGRVPGTREKIPHPNYIIVYRVLTDKIEIVNIVHSRRQYP